jgi:hypothetical protein
MNDDSYLRGRADERRRVASILLDPAAEGRAELAIVLAVSSMLTVPAAVRTLSELAEIDAQRAAPRANAKRK